MSNYRRARNGSTYFFTVVTHKRRPILCLEKSRITLRRILLDLKQIRPFVIKAWVLLPDHIHCIWTLPEDDRDYSMRWGWLKKEFSKRMRKIKAFEDLVSTPDPGSSRTRQRDENVWQRRFWEHMIRDDDDYRMHCDYIHFNPVRHGLVSRPRDWPYSTFHKYARNGVYRESWGGFETTFPEGVCGE